jgi:hypothetical protein
VQPRIDQEPLTVQLRRLGRWLAPGLLVAVLAVVATSYRIQVVPPSVEPDSAEFAAASTQVLVDFPVESVLLETESSVGPLAERANVYARLAATPAVRALIAEEAGIDSSQIDATGPYNPEAQRIVREPTAERRASQLSAEHKSYRLRFDIEQNEVVPIVLVYSQAPTVREATRLADAGAVGLSKFVTQVQEEQGVRDDERLQLRQLGSAEGGVVNPGVDRQIAILAFFGGLFAWSVLVLLAYNLLGFLRRRARGVSQQYPAGSPSASDASLESFESPFVGSGR